MNRLPPYRTAGEALRPWDDEDEKPHLNHVFHRHGPEMLERIRRTPPGQAAYSFRGSWFRLHADRPARTALGSHGGVFLHPWRDRCLTNRELAMLQGFPDDFVFVGSKCDVYTQVGNAVPPPMARAVGLAARQMLSEPKAGEPSATPSSRTALTFRDAVGDLPEVAGRRGEAVEYASDPQNEFQRWMREGATTVTEHHAAHHGPKMLEMLPFIPEGKSARDPEVRDSIPEHLRPGRSFRNSYARIRWDEPTPTITRNSGTPSSANCVHPTQPRALTIRESARCQSFRDSCRFAGTDGQKRLQIANAVPPLLAEALGRAVLATFADAPTPPPTQATEADSAMMKLLYGALHGSPGADRRWRKLRETGATDEELQMALAREFGLQGFRQGYQYTGGKKLSIRLAAVGTLTGKALIDATRSVLAIPVCGKVKVRRPAALPAVVPTPLTDEKEAGMQGSTPDKAELRAQIRDFRDRIARGNVQPAWGKWSEFSVRLSSGETVAVLYEPARSHWSDRFSFHGPLSETGFYSHPETEPPEDVEITKFAQEFAEARLQESLKRRAKRAGERTDTQPEASVLGTVPPSAIELGDTTSEKQPLGPKALAPIIYNCDVLDGLRMLPSESIDCAMTSPPYFGQRDYGVEGQIGNEATVEEYFEKLLAVTAEVRRVLKPTGMFFLNIGDKNATNNSPGNKVFGNPSFNVNRPCRALTRVPRNRVPPGFKPKDLLLIPHRVAIAIHQQGWLVRNDVIWFKPNPTPESARDRMTRSHEHVFLFTKNPKYFFNSAANLETARTKPHPHGAGKEAAHDAAIRSAVADAARREPHRVWSPNGCRNKRDVWVIPLEPYKGAHFATFPRKLVENCLVVGCPPGGTVLDPFGGAGTVAVVAIRLGMKCILIELNPDYCELAKQRIKEEWAKSAAKPGGSGG